MSPSNTKTEPKRGFATCGDCNARINLGDTAESQLAATAEHRKVCVKPKPKQDVGPNNGYFMGPPPSER